MTELRQALEEAEVPADISRLKIAIRTVREQGDLTGRFRTAEKDLRDAEQRVARRLEALTPSVADEETLRKMAVPPRAQVQDFRDREQDWQRRLRDACQESSAAQQERDAALSAFKRMVHDEEVVSAEELRDARDRRDALWAMVKSRHVEGKPIPPSRR